MSKKQWIITAAIVLAIAAVLSIFYVPRKLERVMDLPAAEPVSIHGHVSGDVYTLLMSYKTDDIPAMEQFLAPLWDLQMRYTNNSNVYQVGEVSADVTVRFADGSLCRFFISDNGTVRCNDKNYFCKDTEALKDLLAQIESWENTSGLTTSIWGEVSLGPLDQRPFRTQDADQIAEAMALLEELQARRTFDDDTVSVRNDAYNAQMTLTYAGGEAEVWFGEWGWLRYQEQNYMAEDPAVTKELMELVKGWIITE